MQNGLRECCIVNEIMHLAVDDEAKRIAIAFGVAGTCCIEIKRAANAFTNRVFYCFGVHGGARTIRAAPNIGTDLE